MYTLANQHLALSLSEGPNVRPLSLTNKLTEHRTRFSRSYELKVMIDGGANRITVPGWRGISVRPETPPANVCAQPAFNEEGWGGYPSGSGQLPGIEFTEAPEYRRTHVFIPRSWEGKSAHFVFGGWRIFDFRSIRVWLNGHLVAHRRVDNRWHEPGDILLPPEFIHYNQDNVIFLELDDQITRTAELDAFDPKGVRELSWQAMWPAQFEQYLYCGTNKKAATFKTKHVAAKRNKLRIDLLDTQTPLQARIDYTLRGNTLSKKVTLKNTGKTAVRILDVHLGHYETKQSVSSGEQGFPVHLETETFFALAHPSGWCKGQDGTIDLIQYPAVRLQPNETFTCMEVVIGVAEAGTSKAAFRSLIESRMRRIKAGHDHAYAVYDNFGCWKKKNEDEFLEDRAREDIFLESLKWQDEARKQTGLHFDFNDIHFWFELTGDIERADPQHFPRGLQPVFKAMQRQGINPGLWIDSTMGHWNIGQNPCSQPLPNIRTRIPAIQSMSQNILPRHRSDQNDVRGSLQEASG